MSGEQYILKEKRLIERAYKERGLSAEGWISQNALAYYLKYAKSVTPVLVETGVKYK